jgi:hypothetical protein
VVFSPVLARATVFNDAGVFAEIRYEISIVRQFLAKIHD